LLVITTENIYNIN